MFILLRSPATNVVHSCMTTTTEERVSQSMLVLNVATDSILITQKAQGVKLCLAKKLKNWPLNLLRS
jgi:hypothetical protein